MKTKSHEPNLSVFHVCTSIAHNIHMQHYGSRSTSHIKRYPTLSISFNNHNYMLDSIRQNHIKCLQLWSSQYQATFSFGRSLPLPLEDTLLITSVLPPHPPLFRRFRAFTFIHCHDRITISRDRRFFTDLRLVYTCNTFDLYSNGLPIR